MKLSLQALNLERCKGFYLIGIMWFHPILDYLKEEPQMLRRLDLSRRWIKKYPKTKALK